MEGPEAGVPRRPEEPPVGEIAADQLEQVIRRAAELQLSAGDETRRTLEEAEVFRIGTEVGLERRHVRHALAELHAEALLPEPPKDPELARRLWGEGTVRASRVVPGDPSDVQSEIESHLRVRESLRPVRRRSGRSLWEPAGSLAGKMQRALDVGGRGYELAQAHSLEVAVTALEPAWCLVTLIADLRKIRSQQAAGWAAGSLPVYLGGAVLVAATAGGPLPLLALGAAGASAGTAAWGTGWSFRKRRSRFELIMEGLLDRLEQGEPLEPERPSWKERLLS